MSEFLDSMRRDFDARMTAHEGMLAHLGLHRARDSARTGRDERHRIAGIWADVVVVGDSDAGRRFQDHPVRTGRQPHGRTACGIQHNGVSVGNAARLRGEGGEWRQRAGLVRVQQAARQRYACGVEALEASAIEQ